MIIVDDYKKIASDAKSQIDDLKDAVSYNQILMEIEKLEVDTPAGGFAWLTLEEIDKQAALPTAFRQFREEI